MKNKIAKILFAISVFAAPLAARASLLWYDNFQYSNGPVIVTSITPPPTGPAGTNSLWIRDSGTASPTSDMFTVNSNLQVCATGGTIISRQDDCFRLLVQTNWALANAGLPGGSGNYGSYTNNLSQPVQPIYASFTVICETTITNYPFTNSPAVAGMTSNILTGVGLPNGQGTYFASFYNTFYGYCGRVQAFTNGAVLPNTWRLGVTDNVGATNAADGGFPVDLAVNTPYQVVEEFDPITLQAATIWVNPIYANQTGASPLDPHYTARDASNAALTNALNAYAFRQPSSFGNAAFLITNCATATTFAEAMTNIWGTNAQPPVVVYQPVGLTNYVGNPFSLSAVANGQGLANLKYQWQQGGTNYTGGYSANNILTISSAQATDSGDFTLVVTTPYGLSTTSAAAHVFISTAADPPKFVTEPVSQTIYSGQSATFSTSVISPDINYVYYQWYSNNVAVAGANSTTFTLNNVSTSVSGSIFSVAATNDVTPNGIVSTNAVLTVLQPQAVSIAYLRSLVNLTTFGPTNSPPSIPYKVTGTVTTYTNLTTGNTSSYYLQDGTAGINIFATGASTFRPAQGDVVTYIGVLSSFTTGLELYADVTPGTIYPYTSFFDTGTTNALPAPIAIPNNFTNTYGFAYVNTNLAGELVRLTDVHFGTNAGLVLSTIANNTVIVTNSSGQNATLTFFDLDLDTAGKTLPTNAVSVTGVLYGFQPTFSVGVTRWADIVTNLSVLIPTNTAGITSFSLSSGNVVIKGTNGQSGGTYYLLASTNVAKPLGQWTVVATNVVNTNGANGAFTFIGTNVASPGTTNLFYILSNTNSNHP